jgi:hypothetical protein
MRRAPVLREPGGLGVAGDDAPNVSGGQRPRRLAGAGQREQEVLAGGGRPGLDPGADGGEGAFVERPAAIVDALVTA